MGLRSAKAAQPSSLKNQVPELGTDEVPTAEIKFNEPMDVMAQRAPAQLDINALSKQMAEEEQAAQGGSPSAMPSPQPSAPLSSQTAPPPLDIKKLSAQMLQEDIDNDEADWWPRVKASFAITPRQEIDIYKKYYGSDNVIVDGKGIISVRKPGSKNFVQADDQMRTTLKDILGDGAGFVFRMAVQQATETAAAITGSTVGSVIPGGGTVGGGAIGAGAGMVASPLAADFVSGKVAEMFGAQEAEIDIKNKLLFDGLINLASAGATKFVGSSIRNAMKDSPINRIQSLASIRKSIEGWVDRYGSSSETPAVFGGRVVSKLQELEDSLGTSVRILDDAALTRAKNLARSGIPDAQPVLNTIKKIEDVILESAGSMDKKTRSMTPFGKIEGNAVLDNLDKHLAILKAHQKSGGLTMRDLIDFTSKFQQLSKYDEDSPLPDVILKAYREIGNAFAKDRNAAFSKLLTGTPGEEILKAMPYDKYSQFMEDVKPLLNTYDKTKNPELIAEALIQKKNATAFKGLVRTLGKDNPMVGDIKASWLAREMSKSIDDASGILDAEKFMKSIKSYGDDMVKETIGDADMLMLKSVARRYSSISKAGINIEDRTGAISGLLADTWRMFQFKTTAPIILGNLIFRMTKGNAIAADYIAKKAWYDAVELLPIEQQAAALSAREGFMASMAGARKVRTKDGYRYLENGDPLYKVTGLPVSKGDAAGSLLRFGSQQTVIGPAGRDKKK